MMMMMIMMTPLVAAIRRGSRGGEMGEFSPPPLTPPPPFFCAPCTELKHRPQALQPGFGSITLLQKFTPHFKILDPRLAMCGWLPHQKKDSEGYVLIDQISFPCTLQRIWHKYDVNYYIMYGETDINKHNLSFEPSQSNVFSGCQQDWLKILIYMFRRYRIAIITKVDPSKMVLPWLSHDWSV